MEEVNEKTWRKFLLISFILKHLHKDDNSAASGKFYKKKRIKIVHAELETRASQDPSALPKLARIQ